MADKSISLGNLTTYNDKIKATYQTKTDNNLTTTDKTIAGAINENKTQLDNISTDLNGYSFVDAPSENEKELYMQEFDTGMIQTKDDSRIDGEDKNLVSVVNGTKASIENHIANHPSGALTTEQEANISKIPQIEADVEQLKKSNTYIVNLAYSEVPKQPDTWVGMPTTIKSANIYSTFYDKYVGNFSEYKVIKEIMGKDTSGAYDINRYIYEPANYKHTIVITAGMHGYEEQAVIALGRFLYHIIEDSAGIESIAYIKKNVRVVIIPIVNVWGFNQSPRKYGTSTGTNPSRNFDYKWDEYVSSGSEWDNKGASAFSEKETQYMRDTYLAFKDSLDFTYDLHTGKSWTKDPFVYFVNSDEVLRPKILTMINDYINPRIIAKGKTPDPEVMETDRALNLYWLNKTQGIPSATIEFATPSVHGTTYCGADEITEYVHNIVNYVACGLNGVEVNGSNIDTSNLVKKEDVPFSFETLTKEQYDSLPIKNGNKVYLVQNYGVYLGTICIISNDNLQGGGDVEVFGEIVTTTLTVNPVTEGGTSSFTVKLDKQPTNNQVVTISKNNADVALDKTSLTFTPSDYSTPQTINITVAEDDDDYLDETCIITITSPNVTTKTLTLSIIDNDEDTGGSTVQGLLAKVDLANGSITDSSGNGNNATLSGTYTTNSDSVSFSGGDGMINTGLKLLQNGDTAFTIKYTFSTTTLTGNTQYFISQGNAVETGTMIHSCYANAHDVKVGSSENVATTFFKFGNSTGCETPTFTISANTKTTCCMTYSNNTVKFYLNGVLKNTKTGINLNMADKNLILGNRIDGARGLNGKVYNYEVYNTCLSDSEVAALT